MSIEYLKFKGGKKYRLIKVPGHTSGIDTDGWPALGAVGECLWTSTINGVCMNFGGNDIIIPFDCLSDVDSSEEEIKDKIEDAILITVMIENPEGVLKLLRGLWRMNKHITIRNLMERGILPPDENEPKTKTKASLKSREECDKNWDQYYNKENLKQNDNSADCLEDYCRMTGMMNEGGMVCID